MSVREIKVKVEFTEGYRERYTEACLQELARRNARDKLNKYYSSNGTQGSVGKAG